MTEGYQALTEHCGVAVLEDRGLVRATGADRARLLHAICTNHVQGLQPGQGCYAFFLNAQGRILADAHILAREQEIMLDTEPETRHSLREHIDAYIIMDDVTVEDASDEYSQIAVEGPASAAVLQACGLPILTEENAHTAWQEGWIARYSATGLPGFRVFAPTHQQQEILTMLYGAGAHQAKQDDVHTARVQQGRPRYGEDFTNAHLPQETRLMNALHFSKGCYLGQEIVERVRSRGHVNKLLCHLQITSDVAPVRGTAVEMDGKPVGEITSAAWIEQQEASLALGYVRTEAVRAGAALTASSALVQVLAPQGI